MILQKKVELDGKCYIWTGAEWYESKTFESPPDAVARKLNALISKQLEQEDLASADIEILLKHASAARDALQYGRAEKLVRRVLQLSPGHTGALAILCSALRASGRPRQALEETAAFRSANYPPLLNSRAAAYCDLEDWEAAKREISRSLAICSSAEAFSVLRRIKAARPGLYEPKRA